MLTSNSILFLNSGFEDTNASSSDLLELQLFEMNKKQEIITIDKLIPQSSSVPVTDITASEGSGDSTVAQDLVSFIVQNLFDLDILKLRK